jgi:hypothetical protein
MFFAFILPFKTVNISYYNLLSFWKTGYKIRATDILCRSLVRLLKSLVLSKFPQALNLLFRLSTDLMLCLLMKQFLQACCY